MATLLQIPAATVHAAAVATVADKQHQALVSYLQQLAAAEVPRPPSHVALALGGEEEREVWTCGQNSYGELAHADTGTRKTPSRVALLLSMRSQALLRLLLASHSSSCGAGSGGDASSGGSSGGSGGDNGRRWRRERRRSKGGR